MPEHIRYKLPTEITPEDEFSVRGHIPVKVLILSEDNYEKYRDGLSYECVEAVVDMPYGMAGPVTTDRPGLTNVVLEPFDYEENMPWCELEIQRDF